MYLRDNEKADYRPKSFSDIHSKLINKGVAEWVCMDVFSHLNDPCNAAHSSGIDMCVCVFFSALSSQFHTVMTKHDTSSYCKITSLSKRCRCENLVLSKISALATVFLICLLLRICYYCVASLFALLPSQQQADGKPFVISALLYTAFKISNNTQVKLFLGFNCCTLVYVQHRNDIYD